MKVFVLAPHENWICDRIAAEWKKYCPDVTTENIQEADVVWLLAGWCSCRISYGFFRLVWWMCPALSALGALGLAHVLPFAVRVRGRIGFLVSAAQGFHEPHLQIETARLQVGDLVAEQVGRDDAHPANGARHLVVEALEDALQVLELLRLVVLLAVDDLAAPSGGHRSAAPRARSALRCVCVSVC